MRCSRAEFAGICLISMGPSAGRDICLTVRKLDGPASQTIHTVRIRFDQMQQWMQMASKSGISILNVSASGSASVVTKQKDQPAVKPQAKKSAPKQVEETKSETKPASSQKRRGRRKAS